MKYMDASTMSSQIQYLKSVINDLPIITATTIVISTMAILAYRDYNAYISMGPHGLPDTLSGWITQLKLTRLARKDVLIPAPYSLEAITGPHDTETYLPLPDLSKRPGPLPDIPNFVAPQRQLTDQASPRMKNEMTTFLDALVAVNPHVFQRQASVIEGFAEAMAWKEGSESTRPDLLTRTRGEICHIHPPDGSTHLVVSLADQKRIIELGWGRRHRLSGSVVPWNYTFVYAPRDAEELEVWKKIVVAGARFCCASQGEVRAP
jgi:hypothetical protein